MGIEKEIFANAIAGIFNKIVLIIPNEYKIILSILIYTIILVSYIIFIWNFYMFISKRDIIGLDLKKYNNLLNSNWHKFWASIKFSLEYIVIVPFIVLFWFSALSIFLLILSKSPSLEHILLISTSIVISIRITAYYNEKLSQELAKIIPFTFLGILLFDPTFLSFSLVLQRFIEIPNLFNLIFIYIISIFILEISIRAIYTIYDFLS